MSCVPFNNFSGTEVVTYAWDHRNRLTQITFMNGTTETKRVEYDYNVANLRIEKRVSTDGGSSWTIERYALDGGDVLLTFDATNTVKNTYFHGPAVDQIFADENALGDILWALSDHQGTVRDWVDAGDANANGTPTQHVTYSAFGEILSATNPATLPDYAYTGREWDADADLYYYRNRWYDAKAKKGTQLIVSEMSCVPLSLPPSPYPSPVPISQQKQAYNGDYRIFVRGSMPLNFTCFVFACSVTGTRGLISPDLTR